MKTIPFLVYMFICRILICLLVLIIVPENLISQVNFACEGFCYDYESNLPLEGVHVYEAQSLIGTTTNKIGHYSLVFDHLPKGLMFSYLGYEIYFLNLSNKSLNINNVKLKQRTYALPEVQIVRGKIEKVTCKKSEFITDYDLYPPNLLVIGFENQMASRAYVGLINEKGELLIQCDIKNPKRLFKDCLGNFHVITGDSAFQIYCTSDSMALIYGCPNTRFVAKIEDCIDVLDDRLYFRKFKFNHQSLSYYFVNAFNHQPVFFWSAENQVNMNIIKRGELEPEDEFLMKFIMTPVYCPLFVIKGEIKIFNHVKNVIETYERSGVKIKSVAITYPSAKDWKPEVIVDQSNGKVYTKFQKGGSIVLREINLSNGQLGNPVVFPEFQFIQKIRIYNHTVYFLYQDHYNDFDSRIYRMQF